MTSVITARDSVSVEPITLVLITLKNGGGPHYLSNRGVTVGGNRYSPYINNSLSIGQQTRRETSDGKNANIIIEFKNDPYQEPTYNYLIEIGETYPFEDADVTIDEVYALKDGTFSDAENLFVGTLESPQGIDLLRFSCAATSAEENAMFKVWNPHMI